MNHLTKFDMTTQWPAPAKLNLFLYITGQRDNGYHDLQTLFQFIDYGDTLTITARQDSHITLTPPLKVSQLKII